MWSGEWQEGCGQESGRRGCGQESSEREGVEGWGCGREKVVGGSV